MAGSPDANRQRAQLLKDSFQHHSDTVEPAKPQRVLIKLGAFHLYKGINPLHQRDLGNYIAEFADGQKSTSLNICIFGAKGVLRTYGGYARPSKLEPFETEKDEGNSWLKPAIDEQVSNAWTLYDLRKLRFQDLGKLDGAMERLIYGYDLLLVVPELTPAEPIR